ncbi:4a-hydroxytetrahydrobiopterin dehydratase [Inquilinus ginsengisoli]|jgi:4a-hydroxytetrahydrobiopterin dehydratase|uniref:4a-hydroxytetrahydrobiopterin dehydratase n=1 Tax=Inquilinus ginsengisoli TaxID=363840 RepID=UPI003D1B76C6
MAAKPRAYPPVEVEARLARDLPRWRFEDGSICRRYETHGWKGTMLAIGAVGHLAEAAWHHPEIAASWGWVEVRLNTHDADGGITDRDFALARKIEEVVTWQPALEGDGLEGTPADPRFSYIKYD